MARRSLLPHDGGGGGEDRPGPTLDWRDVGGKAKRVMVSEVELISQGIPSPALSVFTYTKK